MANDSEKLENLPRVIKLLEPEDGSKPITKKEACNILCISYNTTRLAKLIQIYKDKQTRDKERRAALRGKPASESEIQYIISEYLQGAALDSISNSIYRGIAFIKAVLDQHSVPLRSTAQSYYKPELIPEGACKERFKTDEIVYSARYASVAKIRLELPKKQQNEWVYSIWLVDEKWQQFAYQPASELASLEHITKLGVKL